MVEFLFGESALEWVYERLGIHDHVDQQLDTMEDVEPVAVHDLVIEMLQAGRIEGSVE